MSELPTSSSWPRRLLWLGLAIVAVHVLGQSAIATAVAFAPNAITTQPEVEALPDVLHGRAVSELRVDVGTTSGHAFGLAD